MQGPYLRKYGVETTIDFHLYKTTGTELKTDASHTAGDTTIMKDEGAEANTTNGFTDEGTGYSIVLTNTEMQAARVVIHIIDQGTKTWIDTSIIIETFGHASAMYAIDLSDSVRAGLTALPNAAADAAGGLPISDAGGLDMDAIGGLSGSNPVTLTIQDENSNNIVECAVEIWDSAGTTFYERKTTDSGGQTTHNMDDGTYTIKLHKSGYSFDDETLVVDGTEAETYTGTSYTFPAVPDAGNCILYTKFEDYKSDDISDLTAILKIVSLPHYSGNGAFHESQSIDITYNSVTKVGYWEVVDGARVKLYSTQLGLNHYLTVTADENGYMLFDDDDLETIER